MLPGDAARRATKSSIEPVDLVVGHDRARRWETACRGPGCAYAASGSGAVRRRSAARTGPECVSCRPTIQVAVGVGAEALAMRGDQRLAQRRRSPARVAGDSISWFGLARPSCRTATASPPQINFAPLCAEMPPAPAGQLARLAVASCRPSLPSAGCRSGCRRARRRARTARASGEPPAAAARVERAGRCRPASRCRRSTSAFLSVATRT